MVREIVEWACGGKTEEDPSVHYYVPGVPLTKPELIRAIKEYGLKSVSAVFDYLSGGKEDAASKPGLASLLKTLWHAESSAGTIDVLAWGAVQTGRWGVQTQRAGAFDVEGGFQPKILPKLKPWLRAGYSWSSGDGNPNDSTHGTFFQILPTPRPYARFPFFNMMNNQDNFGILILRPHAKVTLSSEFHALRLSNPNDFWYSGGGVFQPWTFGYTGRGTSGRKSLANLYDTNAEYRVNRKVTLTAYIGYAQGLAVMEQIYPQGKDGRFGYLEFMYKF